MALSTYLIYLSAIFVLTATPGPSVLLCVTHSIQHGFRASTVTALGSLTAIIGIMTLSFTGLGVLIASSELVFSIVKWSGAAYLIYLGLRAFFSDTTEFEESTHGDSTSRYSMATLFKSGFLVGATNPKAIVFFTALFPQFINMTQPLLPQYLLLVSTFAIMEMAWLLLYSWFGAKSSNWIMMKGRAKLFNRFTGSVFIGAGVLLGSSRLQA